MQGTGSPSQRTGGREVKRKFKIDDAVRLRKKVAGREKGWAYIESFFKDIKGGVVLDGYLNQFRCWNVADLRKK